MIFPSLTEDLERLIKNRMLKVWNMLFSYLFIKLQPSYAFNKLNINILSKNCQHWTIL